MLSFVMRRLLISLPILLGVTVVAFVFANLVPGNYIDSLVDPELTTADRQDFAALEEQLGLNKPATERYFIWMKELSTGNLGYSLNTRKPVTQEIGRRIIPTLKLTLTSLVFAIAIGTLLGIASALRPYSFLDNILSISGIVWISIPSFFAAIGCIYLFVIKLEIFPVGGTGPAGVKDVPFHQQLYHLALPALILGLERIAGFMRFARSSMMEVARQDYVTVARAKGLREFNIVFTHTFRNALLPLVTVIGMSLPGLLGGSIIIESIFGWGGLGTYALQAVLQRDYPVILGINLIGAVMVLGSNLLADIAYAVCDPRIRFE